MVIVAKLESKQPKKALGFTQTNLLILLLQVRILILIV
jgi:hypothetical protein